MADIKKMKTSESLDKMTDKSVKNGRASINDSGIEMSEGKEKLERNLNLKCPWILGQLAWARGSSYPFWPCVVTLDPTNLLYFKVQNKGRSQSLMVHVQYFGDGGRHNWVLSHYMMPFSGLDDFRNQEKKISSETKKKDPKFAAAFCPKSGVKKQWGIGVTEAAGLMHLSNEERAFIFEPIVVPEQSSEPPANNLKRKLSPKGSKNSNDSPTPDSKKVKKSEKEDQPSTSEPVDLNLETTSTLEKNKSEDVMTSRRKSTRNQTNVKESVEAPKRQNLRKKTTKLSEEEKTRRDEIDFEDYYNLNKKLWKTDHPDATEEEIKILLREMWEEMDAEEKINNLNRNFDDYRYNSLEQAKSVTLPQKKKKSKNTETDQSEGKNLSKLNDHNADESSKSTAEKEKGIAEKDKIVLEKEKMIAEKKKNLAEKKKSIAEKKKSVAEKEKSILERKKSIAERKKIIAEEEKIIFEEEKSVNEEEKSILEEEKSILEEEKEIDEKQKSLPEKEKGVVGKEKSLTEKEKTLSEKEKSLSEKEKSTTEKGIAEKEKGVTEKKKNIVEKKKSIAERKKNIADRNFSEKEKTTELNTKKDNKENDHDNANLRKEILENGDLQNSKKEGNSKSDDNVKNEKSEVIDKKSNSSEASKKIEEVKETFEEKKEKVDGKEKA